MKDKFIQESGRIPKDAWDKLKGVNMQQSLNKLSAEIINPNRIEKAIKELKGKDFLSTCFRNSLRYGIEETIINIEHAHEDNPIAVENCIGLDTWNLIKKYKGIK